MTSHVLPDDPSPVWDSSFATSADFLVPSPVWDASLQRRKILEHACDAEAVLDGTRLGLIAEPLVAAEGDGSRVTVRLHTQHGDADTVNQGLEETLATIKRNVEQGADPAAP